ncbi:MAG: 3-dehydroquinate synthase [Cryomorphaceae bacterium]|nr:3-dehydroquinate synthase [Flavobacteriales bacterium]
MSNLDIHRIKTPDHEVIVGRYCLAELAEILAGSTYAEVKLFILCDENTLEHCLPLLAGKVERMRNAEVIEVPPGEESKSVEICTRLWSALGELGADRSSVLINLGGGVVTDLGGFIAGTFKRGIRFFNIPTSLLAQVDASVGGKTGIDLGSLKNEVGLFNNPDGVYIDPSFLNTLPRNELLSGFAEMIKHALICSPGYWRAIKEVDFFELESLDALILRSIEIKNEIVASDPYEQGRRKILNFGHSIGHAVEGLSLEGDGKSLLHGEAVAMGMVCEAFISHKFGLLSEAELNEIADFILGIYKRVKLDRLSHHRVIELMRHDKKNRNGKFNLSLLSGIGDSVVDQEVKADLVIESLNFYDRRV